MGGRFGRVLRVGLRGPELGGWGGGGEMDGMGGGGVSRRVGVGYGHGRLRGACAGVMAACRVQGENGREGGGERCVYVVCGAGQRRSVKGRGGAGGGGGGGGGGGWGVLAR